MKLNTLTFAAVVSGAFAATLNNRQGGGSGDGPYGPVTYTTDPSLEQHTIYIPSSTGDNTKFPVIVWGNGGCGADGASNAQLLQQIASYGYLAIASGAPGQQGSTSTQMMTDSIDWAVQNAGNGAYVDVDATKIMAAGFSCGGVQAYDQIWDSRVATIGVFSSGLLENQTAAQSFTKPILYCIGGQSDIAYENAERDFGNLPADTPSWIGNIDVGHGGSLFETNGGLFGKAGLNWLQWLFRDDQEAAAYFTSGYEADGWQVKSQALDLL